MLRHSRAKDGATEPTRVPLPLYGARGATPNHTELEGPPEPSL